MANRAKDITGQRVGKLTAIKFLRKENNRYIWLFRCDCGKEKEVCKQRVLSKLTRSCGCLRGLEPEQASFNAFYTSYVKGALRRNLLFTISKEDFKKMSKQDCHYCGAEPTKERKGTPHLKGYFRSNGIDRKDNNKGYEPHNCVPCCEFCNFAKDTMSYESFIAWIARAYNHVYKSA